MGEFNHWLGTSFSYKFGIDLLTNHTKGKREDYIVALVRDFTERCKK